MPGQAASQVQVAHLAKKVPRRPTHNIEILRLSRLSSTMYSSFIEASTHEEAVGVSPESPDA